jgi:hypothetical protein
MAETRECEDERHADTGSQRFGHWSCGRVGQLQARSAAGLRPINSLLTDALLVRALPPEPLSLY